MITISSLQAQDYRAINGSMYSGSLGVGNNPASIVHAPFVWDITPLALQFKQATNALIIDSLSFISRWKNVNIRSTNGTFKRYLMASQDLRLLNARFRLSKNSAIAFGLSGRSYLTAKTSSLNFQDTLGPLREFMGINIDNTLASAEGRGSGWAEAFATYARTIIFYDNAILNAGITVKYNMGLIGGYVTGTGLDEMAGTVNNSPGYYLTDGNLEYGYSSNMDVVDTSTTYKDSRKNYFKQTNSTIGLSLGAEYIIPEATDDNGYAYSLKIGVSMLDIGINKFQYSGYSRNAILNGPNVSDSLIEAAFSEAYTPADFADTLDMYAGTSNPIPGQFKVYQPTRLIINIDKHLTGNYFINGELTVPLTFALGKKQLLANDMNLISIAPRYETKELGIYLPASVNTHGRFWIGAAVRVGPVLLGVHNLGNIVRKNKLQNGGAYLAFTFRFGNKNNDESDTDGLIGGDRPSPRQLKQLDCPPKAH